jgi:hypothetical protein
MQPTQTPKPLPESIAAAVTDTDVTRLMNLRESKSFLKKRLEQIDIDLSTAEEELITRIEAGARIQSRYPVSINTSERRYPSWKEAFIVAVGEMEAKKVTDSTEPTISKSIVISTK